MTLRIDVWSDYVCPFCYLETPVLAALAAESGEGLAIAWRAFELRPEPAALLDPGGEYLARTWTQSVLPLGAERGLTLRLPPVQPRSRKAFEAAAFARGEGRFDAMHEALFTAFFHEGRDIGDPTTLVAIGEAVGLDGAALAKALDAGTHRGEVLADCREAASLGISGVPAMVVRAEGREPFLLSGALSLETLKRALQEIAEGGRGHGGPLKARRHGLGDRE